MESEGLDVLWFQNDSEPLKHNYVRRLQELMAAGKIPHEKGLSTLRVNHDDWCALLVSGDHCNCNPVFDLEREGKTVRLQ